MSSAGRGHKRNKSEETPIAHLHVPVITQEVVTAIHSPRPQNIFPVTPLVVGEVMSKDDQFYTPHKNNPFTGRFEDASTKVVSNVRDNWREWFDLPSPSRALTPPATPTSQDDYGHWSKPLKFCVRRCHSLPGSPTMFRKEIDRFHLESTSAFATSSRRTFSVTTSIKKLEESLGHDDSFDARSDGSSSNDSALGFDTMLRDLKGHRLPHRQVVRKLSMQDAGTHAHCFPDKPKFRADFYQRRLEINPHDELHLRKKMSTTERPPSWVLEECSDAIGRSYSSSESMSLDESAVLSPTSSYSSYSETDSDLWQSRAQYEWYMFEHSLRSRERFQELVRTWESKHQQATGSSPGQALRPQTQESRRQELGSYLHDRLVDPHLEKTFKELRKKWEGNQSGGGTASAVEARRKNSNNSSTSSVHSSGAAVVRTKPPRSPSSASGQTKPPKP